MSAGIVKKNLVRSGFFCVGLVIGFSLAGPELNGLSSHPFTWKTVLANVIFGFFYSIAFFLLSLFFQFLWEGFIQAIRNKIITENVPEAKKQVG
jgi:hypothetical protein